MMNQYEYLTSIHALSNEDFELMTPHLKTKKIKKGEHLVLPDKIQKDLYFVEEGVLMYWFDMEKKSNIIGFAYPPSLAAIPASFCLQNPASYYLTCLTDCNLKSISYQSLQILFDQSQAIERLFRKISELAVIGLIDRQIELRATTIEERFTRFCQRSPHLFQLIPHKYIAGYLDINPTNFSKLYNSIKI